MLTALFALAVLFREGGVATWGIIDWIKMIVIVAACVGIMYVALRVFGVTIPAWAVVVAIVALVAINIIASL